MIRLVDLLPKRYVLTENMQRISKQEAIDRKMFGPVYHGTTDESRNAILQQGFKVDYNKVHAYPRSEYVDGKLPPIDHLGYGIYFTTSKTIFKSYNQDSSRGLVEYYLDVPRLETINFASAKKMMAWWESQGYDPALAEKSEEGRIQASKDMTKNLSSKYDAVWYKGKTMYRVLDGDQVCVYDPSNIYLVDPSMSKEFEIGSKVVLVQDLVEYKHEYADKSGNGTVVFQSRNKNPFPEDKYYSASKVIGTVLIVPKGMTGEIKNSYVNTKDGNTYFTVKFKKGGTYQNTPKDILKPI